MKKIGKEESENWTKNGEENRRRKKKKGCWVKGMNE